MAEHPGGQDGHALVAMAGLFVPGRLTSITVVALVRAQVLSLRERDFVLAAQAPCSPTAERTCSRIRTSSSFQVWRSPRWSSARAAERYVRAVAKSAA